MIPRIISLRFKQPVLEHLFGNKLLQIASLTAKITHFIGVGSTRGVASEPTFASLHEVLRPFVIHALRNAFTAA